MSYIRCHGVLLWNDVTVDWSSVCTWFGTCSAPGARMLARGLVYPLFVAQTMWFGMCNVCSVKGEWVEHGIKAMKCVAAITNRCTLGWGRNPWGI